MYIYISDCVDVVYELPLLSNNTASKTFLNESGGVQSVDWIFYHWRASLVVTGGICGIRQNIYNLLFKQEVVAAPVIATLSSLLHSSRRPLLDI